MSHYFDAPTGAEKRRTVTVRAFGREFTAETAAGVFSGDGLDHATAVLLREAEPPEQGHVLDLGCGWGPIALALALAEPGLRVDAIDVNPRALALCADNACRLGVGARVRVLASDDVPPDTRYDEIWSNPPIRIGKQALHELLLRWLPRLTDDGCARLVVGKNLGADSLQRWLDEQGWSCERTASSKGFRVFEVRRAKLPRAGASTG